MVDYRFVSAAMIGVSLLLLGCAKNSISDQDCGSAPLFTVSPIATLDLMGVAPLGYFWPPGHLFPTIHSYLWIKRDGDSPRVVPGYFPGKVQVTKVSTYTFYTDASRSTVRYVDYNLEFRACKDVTAYFIHVSDFTDAVRLKLGDLNQDAQCSYNSLENSLLCSRTYDDGPTFAAGEQFGTAGRLSPGIFGLDFNVTDQRVSGHFASPSRWDRDADNVVCPYDYFTAELKDFFYANFTDEANSSRRTREPKCGRIYWDEDGTAQGVWFKPASATYPQDYHFTFAYDNFMGEKAALVLGLTPQERFGTSPAPYLYAVRTDASAAINLGPATITSDGKIHCFQDFQQGFLGSSVSSFVVYIQLTSATELKFEILSQASCPVLAARSFSSNALTYER